LPELATPPGVGGDSRHTLAASAHSVRAIIRQSVAASAGQAERVALEAVDVHGLTPEHVAMIFHADAEHRELIPLVRRNVPSMQRDSAERINRLLQAARVAT